MTNKKQKILSVSCAISLALLAVLLAAAFLVARHGNFNVGWFAALWLLSVVGGILSLRCRDDFKAAGASLTGPIILILVWGCIFMVLTLAIIVIGAMGLWA